MLTAEDMMTGESRRFRSPDERVAGEVVGGEAVIIDLASGAYYNLNEAGTWAWQHVTGGHLLDDVARAIAARFDTTVETAMRDTARLIAELESEGLIVPRDADLPPADPPRWEGAERKPYDPPAFETYRDLATLLALDPPAPQLVDRPVGGVGHERDE